MADAIQKLWSLTPGAHGRVESWYPAGWTPPYSLPSGAGSVVHVTLSGNTFNSIVPAGISAGNWTLANWTVYGQGVFLPGFDVLGAYAIGFGNVGHDDGHNYYGAVWSVRTGQWTLLTPTNTGISRMVGYGVGQNYTVAETTGSPYYSVSGTTPSASVPAGAHAYRNLVPYSDGTRYGRAYWVHRGGATRLPVNAQAAHRITLLGLSSFTFAEAGVCSTARGTDDDAVVVIGTTAYRITSSNNSFTSLETYDFLTESYGLTGTYTAPAANCSANGACWPHAGRYIVKRGAANTLWLFDVQTPANGWVALTTSGTLPAAAQDVPALYGGAYYWVPKAGGTSLTKLTPPADPVAGTWVFGTSSVSTSLPSHPTAGDVYSGQFAFSIGSTQYLARPVGGDNGMHLFIPAS